MKTRLPFRALLLFLTSVPLMAATDDVSYQKEKDIAYYEGGGSDPYQQEQCKLDVYYPENSSDFPTVVWFHAGGLKRGERYVPGHLLKRGVAVVAASYRLNPKVQAPVYIEDAAAAVAWTFKNIDNYGGSDRKIVVAGASAGAYLSLMIGLDPNYLQKHGIDANRLAGIGAISGQVITHVTVREEQGIARDQPTIDRYAPLAHMRKDAPPILLVTGGREEELLARTEENAYFYRMMKLIGHRDIQHFALEGFAHKDIEAPAHYHLRLFLERLFPETK
jgi:acetyl esterase/lipase